MAEHDENCEASGPESYPGLWMLVALLTVALPIVVFPWGYQAFTPIRQWLLGTTVCLGVVILLAYWLRRKRVALVLTGVEIPWAVFLVVLLTSTVLSMHVSTGIWGSFFFREGLVTSILYFVVFCLAVQGFRTEKDGHRLVFALKYASIVIGAYGLMQFIRLDPLRSLVPSFEGKASSLLGNPAYLGGYLALVAPLFLCLAINPEASSRERRSSICTFIFLATVAVVTGSRAAWISLALTSAVALTFALLGRGNTMPRSFLKAFGSVILVLAIAFGVALGVSGEFREKTFTSAAQLPNSLETRGMTWRRSIAMIADEPLFGHGPGTYEFAFPGYINRAWEDNIGHGSIPNDPHNLLLNIASSSGLVGLAAFLWLLVALLVKVFRKAFRAGGKRRYLIGGLLLGGIGYLVNLMFHPGIIETTALFWILMGCALGLPASALKAKETVGETANDEEVEHVQGNKIVVASLKGKKSVALTWCALVVAVGALLACAVFFFRPVVADAFLKSAFENWSSGNASEAIGDAQSAASWDNRYGFARLVEARMLYNVACGEGSEELFKAVEDKLSALIMDYPDWEVAAMTLGHAYIADFEEFPCPGDPEKRALLEKATRLFEGILDRDPEYLDAQLKLARIKLFSCKYDEALRCLEEIIDRRPDWPEPYVVSGQCYLWKGDPVKAEYYFEKANEVAGRGPTGE